MKVLKALTMALSLATVTFAANWTGSTSEPENMKKIDGKAFYVITTADELAWFAAQVNGGKTTINAVLDNDIVFGKDKNSTSTINWTPIGSDSSKMFNGILDGGGFTIYGLYVTGSKFSGLVGVLNKDGVVRNLKTAKGSIVGNVKKGYLGDAVAYNNGFITDVLCSDLISVKANKKDTLIVGGIAGVNNGSIENVVREGAIEVGLGLRQAGGVTGINVGKIKKSKNKGTVSALKAAGGIAAVNKGTISFVENIGLISSSLNDSLVTDSSYAAGCVAINEQTIVQCANYAEIKSNLKSYGGLILTSGIGSLNKGIIKDCFNVGKVEAASRAGCKKYKDGYSGCRSPHGDAGGCVARNESSSALIQNCYSVASSVSSENDNGGVVGENLASARVINSYYDSSVLPNKNSVGANSGNLNTVAAKTTADMKKDQFAWILNTSNGTEKNSGVWTRGADGYPTFANEDSLAIHKVVFDDEGTTSNRYTNYKGQASFPENPEPAEGYIFSGWYNTDEIKVKPTTVFTTDQTVKAVYTDASDVFWTVAFYNAAPADTVLESKSYQHGSIVTYGGETPTLTATAKYTYTFKGWDVEPTNAVEDFEYHAVYDSTIRSYTVTFNNTDGTKIESATFEYGKMPSCSETPTRDATAEWKYSHKGWKPALDYVTEAATYTAIYDSSKVEYKVTFMNGVTVIDEQMVPYGDAAVAPTNVTREGYKFVGWNTSFAKVTEALTVKALFEELIIRTVNVVDGSGDEIVNATVEDGEKYTLPEAPKKDGYTFDAYYDGNKKIGVAGDEISVTANITIIAKYIENPKSSSSSVVSSSSKEIAKSSSSSRNNESSSSKTVSSSSTAKSSSSVVKSSSSSVPKSSSSSVKSSSSSKAKSSSSKKTDAIVVAKIPQFSIQVIAHNVQISKARVGSAYALFDMQGKVLQQGQVYTTNFNMSVARPGNYLLKIDNRIQRVVIK